MDAVQESNLGHSYITPDSFLPIGCKFCDGIISAKLGSTRLVCLSCNTEFDLKELKL